MNYYFAYNLFRTPTDIQWSAVPDDLWQKLLEAMSGLLGIDAVGFQNIQSVDQLKEFPAFSKAETKDVVVATYAPYHRESLTTIMTFQFDSELLRILKSESFDQWNAANDLLPLDELVFFQEGKARDIAVPYENVILFNQLSMDELRGLAQLDYRLATNMHQR